MYRFLDRLSLYFTLLLKGALDMTGINSRIARQRRNHSGLPTQSRRVTFQPLFG